MKISLSKILYQLLMYAHVKKVFKDVSQICATLLRQKQNKCKYYVVLKVYYRIHTLEVAGLYLCSCYQTMSSREFILVLLGITFC